MATGKATSRWRYTSSTRYGRWIPRRAPADVTQVGLVDGNPARCRSARRYRHHLRHESTGVKYIVYAHAPATSFYVRRSRSRAACCRNRVGQPGSLHARALRSSRRWRSSFLPLPPVARRRQYTVRCREYEASRYTARTAGEPSDDDRLRTDVEKNAIDLAHYAAARLLQNVRDQFNAPVSAYFRHVALAIKPSQGADHAAQVWLRVQGYLASRSPHGSEVRSPLQRTCV